MGGESFLLPEAEPDHVLLLSAVSHVALHVQTAVRGGFVRPVQGHDPWLAAAYAEQPGETSL